MRRIWSAAAVNFMRFRYGCDQVWLAICTCPASTMGRSAGALADHDGLAPLTKNVSRVPVSRQNCANAPTTGTLAPSSTVSANWLPSPGSRVSTPAGGGIRPTGIFHLMGTAVLTGARLIAATTPTAIAHSRVRRSMSGMRVNATPVMADLETLRCLNFRKIAGLA